DRLHNALLKKFCISKKQWCIPTEQKQSRNQPRIRIAFEIMVTGNIFNAPQNSIMRAPSIPQKFNHGNYDRQTNSGNGAEYSHSQKANNGQPKFPSLNAID